MNIEYVADFETTSIERYTTITIKNKPITVFDPKNSETFVCAWAIAERDAISSDAVVTGRTIEQFMKYVEGLASHIKKRDNLNVFTHNLKFDGSFILYYVLHNDKYKVEDEVRDTQWYSFKVVFPSGAECTFRDSSKIFTCTADELGKTYGIKKLLGYWDYHKYRDENTPISDEEWEYVKHDVLIVCKALSDYRGKGYTQNTAAAIAYNQRLTKTYPKFNKARYTNLKKNNYAKFRSLFPFDIMPLERETHIELMNAYFGGWTWLNPHYAEQELYNISSFDENSMYPDKMANWVLPVNQPEIYENPSKFDLEDIRRFYRCIIYKVEHLTLKLKDEWALPMLMFDTDPDTSVRCQGKVIECENETVYLTNYDYQMMQNEYKVISGKITKVFAFQSVKGQYRHYVKYWMDVKAEHTILKNKAKEEGNLEEANLHEQMRSIAKLMINSPYGKDGTKLIRLAKTSKLNDDDILDSDTHVEETCIEYYLPSAIFICAAARWNLYEALKVAGKSFIYSDTDSLKVFPEGRTAMYKAAEEGKLKIDDAELGAWKEEAIYEKAKFVRQKTYATYEDGEWHYTVCGAPDTVKQCFNIEDFRRGMIITLDQIHKCKDENGNPCQGKLTPVAVKGGVILRESGFQIATMEDWQQYMGDNLPIEKFIDFMNGGK